MEREERAEEMLEERVGEKPEDRPEGKFEERFEGRFEERAEERCGGRVEKLLLVGVLGTDMEALIFSSFSCHVMLAGNFVEDDDCLEGLCKGASDRCLEGGVACRVSSRHIV